MAEVTITMSGRTVTYTGEEARCVLIRFEVGGDNSDVLEDSNVAEEVNESVQKKYREIMNGGNYDGNNSK